MKLFVAFLLALTPVVLTAQNGTLTFESNAAINVASFVFKPTNLIFSASDEEIIKQYPKLCFIDNKCVDMADIILFMHEKTK